MKDLLYVIILNYNGYDDTTECIKSVLQSTYHPLEILIVDNASADESVSKLHERFPEISLLKMKQNLGYAGANNRGIEWSLENGTEYICLLNNDIKVEKDCFSILVEKIKKKKYALVGPATLFWDDGLVHTTGLKFNFYKGEAELLNFKKEVEDIQEENINCDYLEGTCLVFSKELFKKAGYLSEDYFLYYEETDWCCRIKRMGMSVLCIPKAKLWHKGSASVKKVTGLKQYFDIRNRIMFEKRNAFAGAKIIFYMYFSIQIFWWLLTGRCKVASLKAVKDGVMERISQDILNLVK